MVRLFARTFLWRVGVGWQSWRTMDPRPHAVIDRITPRPVFLIQGSEDEMAPAGQAGEPREIWIVEGAGHRGLREHTGGEYARHVLASLDEHAPRLRRSGVVP